ncbi:reverse transcriptase domain-containing protein [Tanacetum coccineum]
MVPATTPLLGFSGEISWPLGQISLMVTLGDEKHSTNALMNFMVVRSPSPYNGIIGRPGLRKIQAVPSTAYGMLKFPVEGGIVTIRSTTIIPAECRMVTNAQDLSPPKEPAVTERIEVAIHPEYPDQTVMIGGSLSEKGRMELCKKEGGQAPDRNKAIQEEVAKLVEAGIMKEVHYHDWLSNPVMVKKHDGSWRMCVDFTDLNKSYLKDCYPLPEIVWKVESLCGYPFKCFLEAYKGYHQIQMAEEDEEKTAFHTNQGVFCYTKMSFDLKNAGATYQRLVDKAFEKQIGQNLEGIKAYPEKVEAVVKLHSPQTLKEAQSLHGKLASLNRFLSKSVEKSLPFFKTLKRCINKSDFQWTPEAEKAFQSMKECIVELPMVTAPKPKEELIIYLCAAKEALSAVLLTERDSRQMPIYFVSRALQASEINYSPMEKSGLSISARYKKAKKIFPILADFIAEKPDEEEPPVGVQTEEEVPEPWVLFTDGSSCLEGSGAGLILTSPEGEELTYALRFEFDASNNEAEYEALIAGLRIGEQMGVKNLITKVDSRLVANQINRLYEAKEQSMTRYLEKARTLIGGFEKFSIEQVPWSENKKADAVSKIASTSFAHLTKQVLVETLKR